MFCPSRMHKTPRENLSRQESLTLEWLNRLTPELWSEATLEYLRGFRNAPHRFIARDMAALAPTAEEEFLLDDFFDVITFEPICIPVVLNNRFYDVKTLTSLPSTADGLRQDPFSRMDFFLFEVQPGQVLLERFPEILHQIRKNRGANADTPQAIAGALEIVDADLHVEKKSRECNLCNII